MGGRRRPAGRVVRVAGITILCIGWMLGALAPAGAEEPPGSPEPPGNAEPYLIAIGDVLDITFFKTSDLNQTRTVGPDGELFLPLVGRVQVVGRSVGEITEELTRRYAKELVSPLITVGVREFSGMKIYVGGEVERPGYLPYRGGLTALQAIVSAGGFRRTARLKHVVLIRKGPDDRPVGSVINLKKLLEKADFNRDVSLAPSDILYIPRSKIANVNLFVEQYIRNNLPIPLGFGFNINAN